MMTVQTVRFHPVDALQAQRLAERDGMSLSAWIRRLIDAEIARRDGRCPTCGHEMADTHTSPTPPAPEGPETLTEPRKEQS